MSKPIRVKVEQNPKPNLRKLARALLMLVDEQANKPAAKPKRKAS
jgi:hypothetical protein